MRKYLKATFLFAAIPIFTACSDKVVSDHEHENDGNYQASFSAEEGLKISRKMGKAISLKTTNVEYRNIVTSVDLRGRIISKGGGVITICAKVPLAEVDSLRGLRPVGGKLENLDTFAGKISGFADIVFTLPKSGNESVGDFRLVRLVGKERKVPVVPASALIESVNGFFIYKELDGNYKFTKVDVGARENGLAEITGGLKENDTVVSSPAERLRLIELKLTKGGGHGH